MLQASFRVKQPYRDDSSEKKKTETKLSRIIHSFFLTLFLYFFVNYSDMIGMGPQDTELTDPGIQRGVENDRIS